MTDRPVLPRRRLDFDANQPPERGLEWLVTNGIGTLTLTVNGTGLVNPIDQFAIDFANLTIDGRTAIAAVPEPASLMLLAAGLGATVARRRIASRRP